MDKCSKEELDKEKDSNIFTKELLSFYNESTLFFHILNSMLLCHFLICAGVVSQFVYIQ